MSLQLPRLRLDTILIDLGKPTQVFQQWWDAFCRQIEDQINTINGQLQTAINTAQSAATTANLAAATAQTAANTANTLATNVGRELSRITSYPNPGSILTATDTGSAAKITIGNHTRVYPVELGVTIPNVTFTNTPYDITGLSYDTKYYIYYDDTTLSVTNPTFVATTDSATAQVGGAAGRHIVGFITTPVSGGGGTTGTGGGTPGGGGGGGGGGYIP